MHTTYYFVWYPTIRHAILIEQNHIHVTVPSEQTPYTHIAKVENAHKTEKDIKNKSIQKKATQT